MPRDWRRIVIQLNKELSLRELSEQLDTSPSSLMDLKAGRTQEPRHSLGEKLLAMHERLTQSA